MRLSVFVFFSHFLSIYRKFSFYSKIRISFSVLFWTYQSMCTTRVVRLWLSLPCLVSRVFRVTWRHYTVRVRGNKTDTLQVARYTLTHCAVEDITHWHTPGWRIQTGYLKINCVVLEGAHCTSEDCITLHLSISGRHPIVKLQWWSSRPASSSSLSFHGALLINAQHCNYELLYPL